MAVSILLLISLVLALAYSILIACGLPMIACQIYMMTPRDFSDLEIGFL